jgi:Ca2+-transporting ATPase
VTNDRAPGRLRIEVLGLKRNEPLAADLEAAFEAAADGGTIRGVSISSRTGRILVTFNPRLTHADVLDRLRAVLHGDGAAVAASGSSRAPTRRRARAAAHAGKSDRRRDNRSAADPPGHESNRGEGESPAWHGMTAEAAARHFNVDVVRGLSAQEVKRRRARYGRNTVEDRPPTSPLVLLGRQFASLPVGLLLGASALSAATGGVADALVTMAVIGGNAAVGYATESGSERLIRSMTAPQTSQVAVLRAGREMRIPQEELVPGDILILRPNAVVAADARVMAAEDLTVNEALLTGESDAVEKFATAVLMAGTPLADRHNMVHRGSFVVGGTGRALVVACGAATEVGKIQVETRGIETPRTPLERDLENLGAKLALLSLGACAAFFATGFLGGRPVLSMLKSAVALAVAAVPEGLPVTATTTLALGLNELRRRGVIVRRLEAVEALGSMQVVCFDKTGTLTQNRMRLEHAHLGADGSVVDLADAAVEAHHAQALRRLLEIAVLCSEVQFESTEGGLAPVGSSTEAALALGAIGCGIAPTDLRARWPLLDMAYRTEANRFMRSVHGGSREARRLVAVKGDPHQVLGLCRLVMNEDGTSMRLGAAARRRLAGATDDLAGRGLRVLGFAFAETDAGDPAEAELVWVGAAALKDPVAPGVKSLISRLREAHVRPIMITGDQAATAQAIASEIGLNGTRAIRVLEAGALDRIPPELLTAVAQQTDVFARVPPSKKLRIVEALQSSGLIVGMSGDGFNDAPALRAANIAIAVGKQSATAARDVADIIVDERNIEAIADGIEQGRTILSNIRKSVHYLISTNLSEILVLLAESVITNDELESPLELLWLNLVTDILPALGLALEPPERDVMRRPPRPADEPLLAMSDLRSALLESVVIAGATLGAHTYGLLRYGPGYETRTVTFLSLVTTQLLHALACRHDRFEPLGGRALFGNANLNYALLGSAALQGVALVSPMARRFLGISAPGPLDLVVAGAAGLGAFAVNEAILAIKSQGVSS